MKINSSEELQAAIRHLEYQEKINKSKLIDQFHKTHESLKPINILKSSLGKIVKSPAAVHNVVNTAVGLGTGLLSKSLVGKSTGIAKRLLITGLELATVGLVSKNSQSIKSRGLNLLGKIFKSKKSPKIGN
jgi:hypothetical protein